MKAEDDKDDFPAMGRALARLEAVRSEVYYGPSWNQEGFLEFGRAILDVFQLSWVVEDSMGVRAILARQYLWVVCPELSLPCGLHSEMLYELLEDDPEDEDGLEFIPLLEDALEWPWPWFRPEDAGDSLHQTEFNCRSLAERVAERVSSEISLIWCKCVFGPTENRRDPRPEMQEGLDWLERLQRELPSHNRISFLLAGHMLELLDGPAGLKWLEIEERNHPGLFEIEELRNALRNPPERWDRDGKIS